MSSQHLHRRRGASAATPILLTTCGEDKPPAAGVPAADYPCVRRSRHRRLLAFLWLQGFEAAFGSMVGETDAFFSVARLRQLVEQAQWRDAAMYLSRFLPRDTAGLSVEAQVLHSFLHSHWTVHNVVADTKDGDALAATYSTWIHIHHDNTVINGAVRLHCIFLNILHAKQQLRTPELKDLVLMPGGPMKPHDVLPIGFGLRRRYCFKKQVRRPRASALSKLFLLKRSLPASSNHSQGSHEHDEILNKALNWTADAIDDCLKAGKRPELHQQHPLQQSGNEGATSNAVLQNTSATLTNHAINSMVSTVRGAGAPVAPLYQNMFGNMAGPVRKPWVPVVANAGFANPLLRTPTAQVSQTTWASQVQTPCAPFMGRAPVLHTMFASHVPSPRAPLSQTMFASHVPAPGAQMSVHAPFSQTMLASNLPTSGTPFSGSMFRAPVSQTVFGCLTNPDQSSGISLMTNTGAKHPSQEKVGSSQQALNPENHPKAELGTSSEQDLDPERERTTDMGDQN